MAGRSRSRVEPVISIRGMKDFRRDLRKLSVQMPRDLARSIRDALEEVVVPQAKERARAIPGRHGGRSVQAKSADTIRAFGTQTRQGLAWGGRARAPWAAGAFMGSKRYRQFPAWIGNQYENPWQPGGGREGPGGGPYAINPAVAETAEEVIDRVGDALVEAAASTFPIPVPGAD